MKNESITLIVKHLTFATFGLMGKEKPYPIYFKTRFGIHTFLMKFPIDIVILDSKNHVVKLKRSLIPNKFFFWNPKYYQVLELPEGTISKNNIRISTKIFLIYSNTSSGSST